MSDSRKTHDLVYWFGFADGSKKEFVVHLDDETMDLISPPRRDPPPDWTRMSTFRCAHCPLDAAREHCPIAVNLVDLLEFFRNSVSHETVDISIETPARTYAKRTSLQSGVSSLIGIYMVSGGCPIMGRLKPMVRHHLPFATLDETRYRAIAMYLLAQHFIAKRGGTPDPSLAGLVRIYDDIRVINQNFCNTLAQQKVRDASLNAISILDSFADFTSSTIDYEMTGDMETLFEAYLPPPPEAD